LGKTLIHNFRSAESFLQNVDWLVFDKQIISFGNKDQLAEHLDNVDETIDAEAGYLTSGLIETHSHGGNGFELDSSITSFREIRKFHKEQGIARSAISLVSSRPRHLFAVLETASKYMDEDPDFLGVHLEGPFISPAFKGAHEADALMEPTNELIERLVSIAEKSPKNPIFSMTVAPELFGSKQLSMLSDAGIHLCLGHTNCDHAQAKDFFESHGSVMTHAFNAMPGIHHRTPGPIPAAITNDTSYLELIVDGVHVDSEVIKLIEPAKVILVTDSMNAAGLGDGEFTLGSLCVEVSEGIARTEDGALAGSTLTLPEAIRNYAAIASKEQAIRSATSNLAQAYGLKSPAMEPGDDAKLILWDEDMNIRRTFNF